MAKNLDVIRLAKQINAISVSSVFPHLNKLLRQIGSRFLMMAEVRSFYEDAKRKSSAAISAMRLVIQLRP